jgi:hypothetical protein
MAGVDDTRAVVVSLDAGGSAEGKGGIGGIRRVNKREIR